MPKYRMEIVVEFESLNEMPEVTMKGTAEILENVFDALPEPENFDWATSTGSITLKPV